MAKLKQETRSIISRALSKEESDFHLLMTLSLYYLPKKKSDQLSSLIGAVVKRYMDPTFHHKFQVKKMYTESQDIRTKYIRGVNSIMNTLPIPKVISYN